MSAAKIVRPEDDAVILQLVGDDYRVLISGDESNSQYFVFEAVVPPGAGPPLHVQTREEEAFYVLEGQITFYLGAESQVTGPGSFVHVPRGVVHRFQNGTSTAAKILIWFSPAGIEKMFERLSQSFDDYIAIGKEYGVEYMISD